MMFKINDKVKFTSVDSGTVKNGIITNINYADETLQIFSDKKFYAVFWEDVVLADDAAEMQREEQPTNDPVDERKAHYKTMKVEPLSVIADWPIEQQIGACRFMVAKYILRLGKKDAALQEAQKALDWNKALVQVLSGEEINMDVLM